LKRDIWRWPRGPGASSASIRRPPWSAWRARRPGRRLATGCG
jgi:hypothetical protein